jgi:hypothetical protein
VLGVCGGVAGLWGTGGGAHRLVKTAEVLIGCE